MLRFVLARLGVLIPTFLGVTIVAFSLIRLIPGDPIEILVGERGIDPARHAMLRAQFGYDKPLWQQYVSYLGDLAQGDLGRSVVTRQPVIQEFFTLFPATVELAVVAMAASVVFGIPLGVLSAVKRGRLIDQLTRVISLIGVSMPIFWLGLIALVVFYARLGWAPSPGRPAIRPCRSPR